MAVEADWPDAYRVNRYVRGAATTPTAVDALAGFRRFPAWMWRNADVLDFVGWLRAHNERSGRASQGRLLRAGPLQPARLDRGRARLLDKVDPEAAAPGAASLRLLRPRLRRAIPRRTATPPGSGIGQSCETRSSPSSSICAGPRRVRAARRPDRRGRLLLRRAERAAGAERRAVLPDDVPRRGPSWNLRDRHMVETLDALLDSCSRERNPESRRLGPQLAPRRRAGDQMGARGRVERRPARPRATRPRRDLGRVHDVRRHGDRGLRTGMRRPSESGSARPCRGATRPCSTTSAAALLPAPRAATTEWRAWEAAAGARHRGDLPAGDGAGQPLLPRVPAGPVRRRDPFRPDAGRRAARATVRVGAGEVPETFPSGV